MTALSRLDRLLIAADVVFRLADDEDRAAAIVANAIRQYLDGEAPARPALDGMRAPIFPASPPDSEWPALRAAVKGLIDACGWEPVAQRLGTGRDSLRDLLNRKRPPGRGRRARLVRLLEAPPARPAENGRFDA